ncbi:PAS domain S-box protein [Phenylobacterium montanum]|uniref:histidine kinase n=1 Tax=Phenylobacterium montanum TaxID=2823693 RepID=A0A975IT28_9CAUL|nr:PAS domain S-box protein [Caulobacter sp. S6]QUD86417.1 PAS domain S-box protein [Caulobacter sp. S6]
MTTAPRRRQSGSKDVADIKRRLEGIVASAMDAIVTVDHNQAIVLFNPAAERMFGVEADRALGEHISRFIPERFRAAHEQHIARFTRTGATNRAMGSLGAISGLRANGEEFPIEASISQVEIGGDRLATVILRDITERKAVEEARNLLAREVDHRAKNALAVVQAVVSLTRAASTESFIEAVMGRVSSLGRSHVLLARNRWEGAELGQLVADECAAYQRPGHVRIDCPTIMLTPDSVQPVGLLVHELATNAVKYGALSTERGRVDVAARLYLGKGVELTWQETGGPPVTPPTVRGFGSTLINEVVTRQLGGALDILWDKGGLRLTAVLPETACRIDAHPPRESATASPISQTAASEGERLLIVEDESLVAMEIAEQMRRRGWTVVGPALSVDEAFHLIAESALPDVAMLDVHLRGHTVYPLADLLQRGGVPFLFCTGYERLDNPERYAASPIVRKPVNMDQLATELQRIRAAG